MALGPSPGDLAAAFAATLPWPIDDFQREAIEKLESHRGVVVSAPTSSGKTLVAEYAIWRCLEAPAHLLADPSTPSRVIYTTPLKALSNQKYHDLCVRYGEREVGLVTGEHSINDSAPVVVMTTEILRNVLYDEPQRLDTVATVVLDEIHYIDDFPRGTVWEEVIIEAPQHIRLIGLSATISNLEEVAAWMSGLRGSIATVVRTERPVALEMWLSIDNHLRPLFDAEGNANRKTLDAAQNQEVAGGRWRYTRHAPDNDLIRVIGELRSRDMLPVIYFIFSRRGCREALARCSVHGLKLTSAAEQARIEKEFASRLRAIDDADERSVFRDSIDAVALRNGIAMHHAGMLPYAKECIEQLFHAGLIKVVFATETLSLGLNMPARACVVSSFTKFDGTKFAALSSGELTQLMGRAGRRGIDIIGHGVILKEADVDIRDIYDAALGGEMVVVSKFAPTYTMTLTLLRTRSVEQAEALLEKSFGQYQSVHGADHWAVRRDNLQDRLADLEQRVFKHPSVRCTERTLTQFVSADREIQDGNQALRRAKRERFQAARRGGHSGRAGDPGGRIERMQRDLKVLHRRVNESPCRHCPYLADHRAQRWEIDDIESTLTSGTAELSEAKDRYRREFQALRAVLTEAGFLANDKPTDLGLLASSLYGENSLLVADAVAAGILGHLEPADLAAVLVMVTAEDRGRDRPATNNRDRFPTGASERTGRALRTVFLRLAALEQQHGLETLRPLSYDFIRPAHQWASGVPLTDIEAPGQADLGDVVKAVKNLYSLLRQMEQALRKHPMHGLVVRTREALERDLIRRV